MENVKIILASESPRRQQMLSWILPEFDCKPADIDETPLSGELPAAYCRRMALGKALHIAESTAEDAVVIGSDTTVCLGPQIFGKPRDPAHAREMLRLLSDREHKVLTAAAVARIHSGTIRIWQSLCETAVRMRCMSYAEIDRYIESGDSRGKAGAYAIQNREFHPVESIRGCYAGVMGFPLCHINVMLLKAGVEPYAQVRSACTAGTRVPCTVMPPIQIDSVSTSGTERGL